MGLVEGESSASDAGILDRLGGGGGRLPSPFFFVALDEDKLGDGDARCLERSFEDGGLFFVFFLLGGPGAADHDARFISSFFFYFLLFFFFVWNGRLSFAAR